MILKCRGVLLKTLICKQNCYYLFTFLGIALGHYILTADHDILYIFQGQLFGHG